MILPAALVLFIGGLALRALSPLPKARRWGLGFAVWGAGLSTLASSLGSLLPPLVLGLMLAAAWHRGQGPR